MLSKRLSLFLLLILAVALLSFAEAENLQHKVHNVGDSPTETAPDAGTNRLGKPGAKKGRVKKVLMLFWAILFVAMLGGMVYAIWKVLTVTRVMISQEACRLYLNHS